MMQDESPLLTPREFDYWKLLYRELVISPEWSKLNAAAKAERFLEKIEAKLSEADAPPQIKALFHCARDERLKTVRQMMEHFKREDRS